MAGPVEVLRTGDLPVGSVTPCGSGAAGWPSSCVSGWYALEDECSHQGGPLGEGDLVAEGVLRGPWHGARFDVRTGEVLDGPAARPARTYPVTADDGLVTVAVDNAVEAAAAAATDSRRRGGPGWRRSRPPPDPDPRTTNPPSSRGRPRRAGRCRRHALGPGDAAGPGAGASGPTATTSRSTTASGSNGTRMVSRSTSAPSPSTTQRGVGSISAADRGTRYRWYGLYTQRPKRMGTS